MDIRKCLPMPRYHFDLRDGDAFAEDEEGVELSDCAPKWTSADHFELMGSRPK